jgi:hypothetical protein
MIGTMLRAHRRGDGFWFNVLLWISCYLTAVVIHSTFDVALEGPMVGIWFWSLFGLGIATAMVYRASLKEGGLHVDDRLTRSPTSSAS